MHVGMNVAMNSYSYVSWIPVFICSSYLNDTGNFIVQASEAYGELQVIGIGFSVRSHPH
jgi:hypothetical protein